MEAYAKAIESLSQFEPDPYEGYAVEYINPSTGQTANPTMAAWIQKLPKGFRTKAQRHTHASIHQVYKGSGYRLLMAFVLIGKKEITSVFQTGHGMSMWQLKTHISSQRTTFQLWKNSMLKNAKHMIKIMVNKRVTSEFKPLLP